MTTTEELTDRQREVQELLDKDLTPRQVADLLGVSTQAIYGIRQRIRERLGEDVRECA